MTATRVRVFLASAIAGTVLVTWPAAAPVASDQRSILHVLNRVGYRPTAAAIEQVERAGGQSYVDGAARVPSECPIPRWPRGSPASPRSRRARAIWPPTTSCPRCSSAATRSGVPGRRGLPTRRRQPARLPARTPEQTEAMRMQRDVHRRAVAAEDPARRLQRAAARRSDGRFLVQPLQRVRRQGPDAALPDRVRARRDPAARARQVPRSARRDRAEPGDALLSRQLAERRTRRRARPRRTPGATSACRRSAAPAADRRRRPRMPRTRDRRCADAPDSRRSSDAAASTRTTRAS